MEISMTPTCEKCKSAGKHYELLPVTNGTGNVMWKCNNPECGYVIGVE